MSGYSHVVVIGVDGAGAFFKETHTPCFDRIFASGAVTYEALASKPTISAECWGSMLLGVGPEVHKLTNAIVDEVPYAVDAPFPSLFRRIRAEMPEAELGSFCEWGPINYGIVEARQNVTMQSAPDDQLVPLICRYIKEKKPTFLFTQWDSVDGVGHGNGYGSEAHLKRISEIDGMIGEVYEAIRQSGSAEETLFIVIADHGGTPPCVGRGGSHGGWSDAEKYVTFALAGKTVQSGTPAPVNIRDLAAVVLYALGLPLPEFCETGWTSQVPPHLFRDHPSPVYRDISHLTGAPPRRSSEPHQSELI